MSKEVILTGLRANNDLHIGNYLGALLPIVDMAKQKAGTYQVNLFVPDLHSFTTPIDHSKLQEAIMNNLRVYVAAGLPLDNPDVHIYRQSYIPAHSELTWILNCFTGFGEMSRMTQYKDKATLSHDRTIELFIRYLRENDPEKYSDLVQYASQMAADPSRKQGPGAEALYKFYTDFEIELNKEAKDRSSIGLFGYPVLMAADILLYGATYVPVGDDQSQHLEFTRDIAERINNKFNSTIFQLPVAVGKQHEFFGKEKGLRIRDLVDPSKKMSKSDQSGKGVIFLGDNPSAAKKKIMSATTDSYGDIQRNYDIRPGISNLLDLLDLFGGNSSEHIGDSNYGLLKAEVAVRIETFLAEFQERMASINDAQLLSKLEKDERLMNKTANTTLREVQKAVGLR